MCDGGGGEGFLAAEAPLIGYLFTNIVSCTRVYVQTHTQRFNFFFLIAEENQLMMPGEYNKAD